TTSRHPGSGRAIAERSRSRHRTTGLEPPSSCSRSKRPTITAAPLRALLSRWWVGSVRGQHRPEALDPIVDLLLADEAEGEAKTVRAASVRKEERPGNERIPLLDRPPCQLHSIDPRQRQPREEASTRRRPPHRLRHRALQRGQRPLALAP